MPLGATKLYLFGISVDQQFRTEYLTRLTDSAALHDMTYIGLPPFYPPGWFWIGGRIAALTGTPGWEMYKPWAITSITIAVAVALVLWWRMIRFEYALIVTTATAAVDAGLQLPGAVLRDDHRAAAAGADPDLVGSARRDPIGRVGRGDRGRDIPGLRGDLLQPAAGLQRLHRGADGPDADGIPLAQGVKAALDPLVRLAVIAVIAAAIAATTWLPFLLRATRDPVSNTGSAYHYLPADGAELTFPMLKFTLLGALCMLGTLWLVVRARSSVRAAGLAIGVLAVYLWSLLSMLATLARTTLLSFRLQPTLTVLLATAGVFGFIEVTLALAARGRDHAWGRSVLPVAAVDRTGRGDRVQPRHPRRAAPGPHHRLHRHRRPRPAR